MPDGHGGIPRFGSPLLLPPTWALARAQTWYRSGAAAAATSLQFELNVTPTSINIYHIYAPGPIQRRNLKLLETMAARLSS